MTSAALNLDDLRGFARGLVAEAGPPFALRIGDEEVHAPSSPPRFTLAIARPEIVVRLIETGDLAELAEAYVTGDLTVQGDVEAAVGLAARLRAMLPASSASSGSPGDGRTEADDARFVRAHYDLPLDFFRLFLDRDLVYSCAYFARPDDTLDEAQRNKLELSARKLMLQPGDQLLDVGCGWGAMLFHGARRYGVTGTGITLSEGQAAHVRDRAQALGLAGRVTASTAHYADLEAESFDKIVSIGMVEHVAIADQPRYFAAMHRALRPGGLFLNHGIMLPRSRKQAIGGAFIQRHVFPGSDIDDVGNTVAQMEDAGLEILDVQSLRPHYGRTLRCWAERWFAHRDEAAELVPETVLRTWDIYLPGCAEGFESGYLGVFQILAYKPDPSGARPAPSTREAIMGAPDDLLTTPSARSV